MELVNIEVATSHGTRPVDAEKYGEFAVHPLVRGSWDDDRITTVTHIRTGYALAFFTEKEYARGFAREVNEIPFDNAEDWIVAGKPDEQTLATLKQLRDKWGGRRLDLLLIEIDMAGT